jgi:hypothetical protein
MSRAFLLLLLILALGGCASVPVTPRSIAAVPDRAGDRDAALRNLRAAVAIANEFLASDFRKTLPAGELVLADDGLTFVTAERRLPVDIRCTSAGDLLIPFKMAAQERADGFVVGSVTPHEHRAIDNSLFRRRSGAPVRDFEVAQLILHELTHEYFRLGTVSLPKTVAYYAEAVLLFRYRTHSMERLPFQTTAEFRAFVRDHFARQQPAVADRISDTGNRIGAD